MGLLRSLMRVPYTLARGIGHYFPQTLIGDVCPGGAWVSLV